MPEEGPGWGDVGITGVPRRLRTGPRGGAGDGARTGPSLLWTGPLADTAPERGRGERSLVDCCGERPLVRLRRGCGEGD